MPQVQVGMGAGLNITAPPTDLKPGEAILAINYEIDLDGRYSRIGGFERYDGQPKPSDATIQGDLSDEALMEALLIDIEARRDVIQPVPGSGWVRGVTIFNGVTYAWRDNAAGDGMDLHMATPTGWQSVSIGVTLQPGGAVQTDQGNAYASGAKGITLYGVDGVNPAFAFDGENYRQISVPGISEAPEFVQFHANHLILGYSKGSIMVSTLGEPEDYSTLPLEIGLGDKLVGMQVQPGGVLALFCRNRTYLLYGKSVDDFDLQPISDNTGAIRGSIQTLGESMFLDDRGIGLLKRTQAFGNFEYGSLSKKVRPIVDRGRDKVAGSLVVRAKNQFRLFFTDGTGLIGTFHNAQFTGWTTFDYGTKVASCLFSGEDSTGKEWLLMGGRDGYVYELGVGRSFDGDNISAVLRPAFMHFGHPNIYKQWHSVTVEAIAEEFARLKMVTDYDYSSEDLPDSDTVELELNGGGGYWGSAVFEQSRWSVAIQEQAQQLLFGTSRTLGFAFQSDSNTELPYSLQSLVIDYSYTGRKL